MVLKTRRSVVRGVVGLLAAPAIISLAHAESQLPTQVSAWEPVKPADIKLARDGKAYGDYECMHAKYHNPYYQNLFGVLGKCSCGSGDCRATDWRETTLGSPKGYDVVVNRNWCALPAGTWIPEPQQVPHELLFERAHVCAYVSGAEILIPCALINKSEA